MADVKISALTAVPSSSAADIFVVVQGGVTLKETLAQSQVVISGTNFAVTKSATAISLSSTDFTSTTVTATNMAVTSTLTALGISFTNLEVTAVSATNLATTNVLAAGNGVTTTFANSAALVLTITDGIVTGVA